MKLACASGAFDTAFVGGDLTQLEFLDLCAHELACDGVVLDVRHFPRTDDDYLAQIKKLTTDYGLTIAALADASFFGCDERQMTAVLERAVALGAPLVAGELLRETDAPWSEQLVKLNTATARAKSLNVTLALRNAPGTFAAGVHDCKRVSKEADSAWLRYGPRPDALGASDDPSELAANSIVLWSDVRMAGERSIAAVIGEFPDFRGHLALDCGDGNAKSGDVRNALHAWRAGLTSLNRT
jgi:hypothetical protein